MTQKSVKRDVNIPLWVGVAVIGKSLAQWVALFGLLGLLDCSPCVFFPGLENLVGTENSVILVVVFTQE